MCVTFVKEMCVTKLCVKCRINVTECERVAKDLHDKVVHEMS